MRIIIYGASDDLIEIDGEFREEFGGGDEYRYLHFDDGTIVRCGHYVGKDIGWKITKVSGPAKARVLATAVEADPEFERDDGSPSHSDCLELIGDFKSVIKCDGIDGPSRDEMLERLVDVDWRDMDDGVLRPLFMKVCSTSMLPRVRRR